MNFFPINQSSASEAPRAGFDASEGTPVASDDSFARLLDNGSNSRALDAPASEAATVPQTSFASIESEVATPELANAISASPESTDTEALAENPFALFFVPSNVSYAATPELAEGIGQHELQVAPALASQSIVAEGSANKEAPVLSVPAAPNADSSLKVNSDLVSPSGTAPDSNLNRHATQDIIAVDRAGLSQLPEVAYASDGVTEESRVLPRPPISDLNASGAADSAAGNRQSQEQTLPTTNGAINPVTENLNERSIAKRADGALPLATDAAQVAVGQPLLPDENGIRSASAGDVSGLDRSPAIQPGLTQQEIQTDVGNVPPSTTQSKGPVLLDDATIALSRSPAIQATEFTAIARQEVPVDTGNQPPATAQPELDAQSIADRTVFAVSDGSGDFKVNAAAAQESVGINQKIVAGDATPTRERPALDPALRPDAQFEDAPSEDGVFSEQRQSVTSSEQPITVLESTVGPAPVFADQLSSASEQHPALTLSVAEPVSEVMVKGNEAGLGNSIAEVATTKVAESLLATNVTSPSEQLASPGEQVKVALATHFRSMDGERVKSLSLELHPAELGHIQIRVEQTGDQLVAQIVATEAASTELLLQQRDQLVKALDALGLGDAELDIFQGDRQQQETEQQRPNIFNQNRSSASALPPTAEETGSDPATSEHTARVNFVA